MKQQELQTTLGLLVIFGHILIMLSIYYFYARGGLLFDEMTTSLTLISPMLAVYTGATIKYLVQNRFRSEEKGRELNLPYIVISFAFPVIYLGLIMLFVYFRAVRTVFSSFNQFTVTLGSLEAVFGIYVGQTLGSLFDLPRHQPRKGRTESARMKSTTP